MKLFPLMWGDLGKMGHFLATDCGEWKVDKSKNAPNFEFSIKLLFIFHMFVI